MARKYTKNWKNKKCIICGEDYSPTNGKSLVCEKKECKYKRKRKYDKVYSKQNKEKVRVWVKKWQQNNKGKVNEIARARWKRDKKLKIRNNTNEFIRKKGIQKYGKCELCGELSDREVHHVKYTKEDFILICRNCHQKIHYGL